MAPARLSLSVVVPAYNEEARLGATVADLQNYLQATLVGLGSAGRRRRLGGPDVRGRRRTGRAGASDRPAARAASWKGRSGAGRVARRAKRLPVHLRRGSLDARRRARAVPAAAAHRRSTWRSGAAKATARAASASPRPAPGRPRLQPPGAAPDGAGHRRHAVRVQDVHGTRRRRHLPDASPWTAGPSTSRFCTSRGRGACGLSKSRSSGTIAASRSSAWCVTASECSASCFDSRSRTER